MDLLNPEYQPTAFLDWLTFDVFKLRNDSQLARRLETCPSAVSKWRSRANPVPLSVLVAAHEVTGLKVSEVRKKLFAGGAK